MKLAKSWLVAISCAITVDFPTVAVLENTTVPFGNNLAEEFSKPSLLIFWAVN